MNIGSTQVRSLTQFVQTDKHVTMSSHTHTHTHAHMHAHKHIHTHNGIHKLSEMRKKQTNKTDYRTMPC